jgi:adenosylcobinamide-GDP ribazoletransferase
MIPDAPQLRELLLNQYRKLVAATGFLSILSLPGSNAVFASYRISDTSFSLGTEYFPLVGLLLGGILWLFSTLLAPLVPSVVLAAMLVVALVILTGGLHLDGLMDACDGLFGGSTRERKLEIMRDSRAGSFGVLGGACALLLKFACLTSLNAHTLAGVLLVTLPTARWSMVLALNTFPNARLDGLGTSFRQHLNSRIPVTACIISLIIVFVSAQFTGLLVWLGVTLISYGLGSWITRKLGGLTGDTYGAIAELAEIAGLLIFILLRF